MTNTHGVPYSTTAHIDPETNDIVVFDSVHQRKATFILNKHGQPALYNETTGATLTLSHPSCHEARAAVLRAITTS